MMLDRSKQWGRRASWGVHVKMGQGAPQCLCKPLPQIMNVNSETEVFVWEGGAEIVNIVNKPTHVTRLHKHLSLDG